MTLIAESQWAQLRELDQVNLYPESGPKAFGFTECLPTNFHPSYKFVSSNVLSSKRSPSWTDRIFYRSQQGQRISFSRYSSHMKYDTSDHKPVSALCSFELCDEFKPIRPESKRYQPMALWKYFIRDTRRFVNENSQNLGILGMMLLALALYKYFLASM